MTNSMKTITIGDLHGKDVWKKFIDENPQIDKWVFVGDYCDAFDKSNAEIQTNLLEIIFLKKEHPDKVELLLGNHDINYMFPTDGFYCSGYRSDMQQSLYVIFNENRKLFKVAYQTGEYLFTHAGINSEWYLRNKKVLNMFDGNYADKLNCILNSRYYNILYDVSRLRGGKSVGGSPLWADKVETMTNSFPVHQIVGHSRVSEIRHINASLRGGYSITYTDCLDKKIDFYELEI